MKIALPRQMIEIDNNTINSLGIPGLILMENAALKVVEEVEKSIGSVKGKKINIFAGKGNNGGDAFAVARHMYNKGAYVMVYIIAKHGDVDGDAKVNLDIISKLGVNILEVSSQNQLDQSEMLLESTDLVIDGIFGTGLRGEVKGVAAQVIKLINQSKKPVISIDIPSGVNGETGQVAGICVKATKTVTFSMPKLGLILHPGCDYTGKLVVCDIGIPKVAAESVAININLIDQSLVCANLPKRIDESNKGDYGKVFIISGSNGMTGAGSLTAGGALRTGSGLVYLGVPSSLTNIYDILSRESITVPLEDKSSGFLTKDSIDVILKKLNTYSVVAAGPGLGSKDDIFDIISAVIEHSTVPLVLDADAINAVSKDVSILGKLKCSAIVTPHPGEMARLTGLSIDKIQNERIETALNFSARWNVITVLKGSRTVIAYPDGTIFINTTGNSGMSTGGTGDVLTGIIASLIGQGMSPGDAAAAGVYIHGLAGDYAADLKGKHGLIAGDLIETIPYVIKNLVQRANKIP